MFLTLDIRGINDIRLISRPIHAPSHELEDTGTNTLPTKVFGKRILVGGKLISHSALATASHHMGM